MKKFLFIAVLVPFFAMAQQPKASEILGIQVTKFHEDSGFLSIEMTVEVDGRRLGPTERWEVTPFVGGVELPLIAACRLHKSRMAERKRVLDNGPMEYHSSLFGIDAVVRGDYRQTYFYRVRVPWKESMRGAPIELKTRHIVCLKEYLSEEKLSSTSIPSR